MAIDIENPGGDAAALKEALLDIILPDIEADDGAAEGAGQAVNLTAGAGGDTGAGGAVSLSAGEGGATSGGGGNVGIQGGGAISGDGGDITLTAGTSNGGDGAGGWIILVPGTKDGTGIPGQIYIEGMGDFLDDAAAAAGGIGVSSLYHTAGVVKVRLA